MSAEAKVLIVEDDAAARTMLSLSLRQAGCIVVSAKSGEEALRLLDEDAFGCMITDGWMSPMDGFELSRRAKRLHPHLRVAMVSAVFSEKQAEDAPIERFFPKPVQMEPVVRWIQSV